MRRLREARTWLLAGFIVVGGIGWDCEREPPGRDGGSDASSLGDAGSEAAPDDATGTAADASASTDSGQGSEAEAESASPGDSGGDGPEGDGAHGDDAGEDASAVGDAAPTDDGLMDVGPDAPASATVAVSPLSLSILASCAPTSPILPTAQFTVANTSATAITWTASVTSPPGAQLQASPSGSTLAPGASVAVSVEFPLTGAYPSAQTINGSIAIATNPPGPPITVAVSESFLGTFLAPLHDVNFGDVPVGGSKSIAIGVSPMSYSVGGNCVVRLGPSIFPPGGPFSMPAGVGTLGGTLVFQPTMTGTFGLMFSVGSTCGLCSPSTFTVTATGI